MSTMLSRKRSAPGTSRPATARSVRRRPHRPNGLSSTAFSSQPQRCRPTPPGHSSTRLVTRSGRRIA
ncbi:hypothetical protein ACFQY4_29435 [Catellatospora bangladeshensis]|uniref:hypothetical protein n=1 Tax=Catellatospora bangladeshensis TaxID=310355 RepID=UPI00361D3B28